jgi:hypothetical protein
MDLPSEDALRWIVRAYARLRAAHGDAIGVPELVHPTAMYFPDEFRGDAPGVARLLRRMMTYAPIADDLHIELAFLAKDDGASTAGCGSIACGSSPGLRTRVRGVEELEDGSRLAPEPACENENARDAPMPVRGRARAPSPMTDSTIPLGDRARTAAR